MVSQGMSRPTSIGPTPPSSLAPQQMQMQMHGPASMPSPSASTFRPPQQRPTQTLQQTRPPLYHGPVQHLQQTPQNTPLPSGPHTSPFLQQASRVPASGSMVPPGGEMGITKVDPPEIGDKIISKKTIQDLFSQVCFHYFAALIVSSSLDFML